MKHLLRFVAVAILTATALSCDKEPVPGPDTDNQDQGNTVQVTSVKLNVETLSLEEGGMATLTATVLPADATNKKVIFKSSNTKVATVSADGRITGKDVKGILEKYQ